MNYLWQGKLYCLFDREIDSRIFQYKWELIEYFSFNEKADYVLYAKTNFKTIRFKFREKLYAELIIKKPNSSNLSIDDFLDSLEVKFSFPKAFITKQGNIYVYDMSLKKKDVILKYIPKMVEKSKNFFQS